MIERKRVIERVTRTRQIPKVTPIAVEPVTKRFEVLLGREPTGGV